ncbi:hypothetical protein [Sinorhizobium meliloti]|uniref:hypothetical protein n=1 Tax=Rhizobium meliloti TaxID=382 RepID=UPI000FDB359F|nr:hypothetical protein [Sinorhizobium meliloti]MQX41676.1 hypothetical protein [Sinorhizobium meliloti]
MIANKLRQLYAALSMVIGFNIHPEEAAGLLWAVARRNAIHRGQTAMPEKLTNKYEITQIKADE